MNQLTQLCINRYENEIDRYGCKKGEYVWYFSFYIPASLVPPDYIEREQDNSGENMELYPYYLIDERQCEGQTGDELTHVTCISNYISKNYEECLLKAMEVFKNLGLEICSIESIDDYSE